MARNLNLINGLTKFRKLFVFMLLLLLGVSGVKAQTSSTVLFHESFGDNSGSARNWNDEYSVKTGVQDVYSGITSYTVTNVKQGKNTTGSTKSGLNQSTQGTDASIIIGPLNVSNYNTLKLVYQWKAGSIKGTYTTSAFYSSSYNGNYIEITGTGDGANGFVERSYSLPESAQVSTLYLKIVFNTSNTQAIIDEVELTGVSNGGEVVIVDPSVSFASESISFVVGSTETNAISKPSDLEVNYESSNTSVATVDADGIVTGIAVGEATITASWDATDKYNAGTKSYTVNVVPAPVVDLYEIVTDASKLSEGDKIIFVNKDGTYAMSATQKTSNRDGVEVVYSNGTISLAQNQTEVQIITLEGSSSGWYFNVGSGYLYAGSNTANQLKTQEKKDKYSKATIEISSNEAIISFQGGYSRSLLKYNSNDKLFSCYSTGQQNVVIYKKVDAPSAVAKPTFSVEDGTYFSAQSVEISCATEGATIYYTLDGSTPSAESTPYSGAISISETTTLKAIAIKDGESSSVATAEYTFPTVYTLGEMNAKTSGTYTVKFANAVVTYVKGKYAFIEDATGAIMLYANNIPYSEKQVLNGVASVTWSLYNGQPEATAIAAIEGADFNTESSVESVSPTIVTLTALNENLDANISKFVKVEGVEVLNVEETTDTNGNKFYSATLKQGDATIAYYGRGVAVEAGEKYDIIGFLGIYEKNETKTYQLVVYDVNHVEEYPAVPTFSPEGGEFEAVQTVTITSTEGADIYYTLDGNDPTTESTKYTEPISINFGTTTVKAFAIKDGLQSDVATATYVVRNNIAQVGEQKFETLQAAVDAAQQLGGEQTVNLLSDISGETVTIKEVANFKLTIDGKKDENSNYTVDAVIVVDGLRGNGGSSTNGASVTLQNIAFVKTTSTDGIQASHYPHDLTIQDCTYSGSDSDKWFLNASVDGPLYGVTVKNVTVEHARLVYANMAEDAVFQNITATNDVKVGFNVKTSGTALIENCQVTTGKYAFRDYSDGYEGTFTLKGNTFVSTSEDKDEGVIVNRGGAVGTAHINVVSGTYTGHVKVLNNKEGVLAISGGYFSEEFPQEYIAADLVAQEKICVPAVDMEGYYTVGDPIPAIEVSAPVVFHDSGKYEAGLSVPMYAQAGEIYYTINGGEKVTREYTIKAAAAEIEAIDGYYSIKNNGNEKYINVAGRKTVTFVADGDEADKAGTVLKVKINTKGQVEELRSQGVDLPGYADRAMNYVPKFVKLIVDKLHAEGSGEILGENGLDAIMQKFNDSFDYHLYVEKVDAGYRIYGKTPSMKPVVDFYAENKDNVDYKLPQLEAFINSAIQKVLQKTGGRGASILTEFKLHDIWQKMGETLTEPVKDDAASIAKFYEEVLASEANVWNFAFQTAMIYWNNVKSHPRYEELKGKLGEYANYIEKVENMCRLHQRG